MLTGKFLVVSAKYNEKYGRTELTLEFDVTRPIYMAASEDMIEGYLKYGPKYARDSAGEYIREEDGRLRLADDQPGPHLFEQLKDPAQASRDVRFSNGGRLYLQQPGDLSQMFDPFERVAVEIHDMQCRVSGAGNPYLIAFGDILPNARQVARILAQPSQASKPAKTRPKKSAPKQKQEDSISCAA